MTRMDCGEVRDLLQSYADDEMLAEERLAVVQHLQSCRDCATALAGLEAMRRRIKAAGTPAMPAGLELRVRRAIGMMDLGRYERRWQRLAAIAASHVAALGLGALLTYGALSQQEARTDISREIVTAHIRSLIAEQLVQVATADSHTVKPWFTGKIPFAPEVVDLGTRDFPMIGGRVDYVLGRPAAAIVYGRRKHRINLFALAIEQPAGSVEFRAARNGYNIVAWRQAGLSYFAASDLNAAELQEFVVLLRNRDSR